MHGDCVAGKTKADPTMDVISKTLIAHPSSALRFRFASQRSFTFSKRGAGEGVASETPLPELRLTSEHAR